jgi:ferredoxin
VIVDCAIYRKGGRQYIDAAKCQPCGQCAAVCMAAAIVIDLDRKGGRP